MTPEEEAREDPRPGDVWKKPHTESLGIAFRELRALEGPVSWRAVCVVTYATFPGGHRVRACSLKTLLSWTKGAKLVKRGEPA